MKRQLHIVTSHQPRPFETPQSNDLYWMLISLLNEGIEVKLHLFESAQQFQEDGIHNKTHTEIYQKQTGHGGFSFRAPFGISSYYNKRLIETLNKDSHPILFHGIETSMNMKEVKTKQRKVYMRIVESKEEKKAQKKQKKLFNRYEKWHDIFSLPRSSYQLQTIQQFPTLITHHGSDHDVEMCIDEDLTVIPHFIGIPTHLGEGGHGNFCLFYGHFDDEATAKTAYWLLDNVFNELDIPVVFVGNNPTKQLETAAHKQLNTCMVANPATKERIDLIKKSQLVILPDRTEKTKKHDLIQPLIFGKHILSLNSISSPEDFENLIHIESEKQSVQSKIKTLFQKTFTEDEKNKREGFLQKHWSDKANVEKLIKLLY